MSRTTSGMSHPHPLLLWAWQTAYGPQPVGYRAASCRASRALEWITRPTPVHLQRPCLKSSAVALAIEHGILAPRARRACALMHEDLRWSNAVAFFVGPEAPAILRICISSPIHRGSLHRRSRARLAQRRCARLAFSSSLSAHDDDLSLDPPPFACLKRIAEHCGGVLLRNISCTVTGPPDRPSSLLPPLCCDTGPETLLRVTQMYAVQQAIYFEIWQAPDGAPSQLLKRLQNSRTGDLVR
jgi:hypothetical protein